MKIIIRFLSLAVLLIISGRRSTVAAAPASYQVQIRGEIEDKVTAAVNQFATENGYSDATIFYESEQDFRIHSANTLLAYGYYDAYAGPDQQGEVFIGPV